MPRQQLAKLTRPRLHEAVARAMDSATILGAAVGTQIYVGRVDGMSAATTAGAVTAEAMPSPAPAQSSRFQSYSPALIHTRSHEYQRNDDDEIENDDAVVIALALTYLISRRML